MSKAGEDLEFRQTKESFGVQHSQNNDVMSGTMTKLNTQLNSPTNKEQQEVEFQQESPNQEQINYVEYYQAIHVQEVPDYSYIEKYKTLTVGHEAINVVSQIFDELLERWEAYEYQKTVINHCFKDYLLSSCSVDFITKAYLLNATRYCDSPILCEEDVITDWTADEEPLPANADTVITFSRPIQVKTVCINNETINNINDTADNKSEQQLIDLLNNSKLSLNSGTTSRNSFKLKLSKTQQNSSTNLKNIMGKFMKQIMEQGKASPKVDISLISKASKQSIFKGPKAIQLTDIYPEMQEEIKELTPKEKEVEDLIEWQRHKKTRDEQRRLELEEFVKKQSQTQYCPFNLDDENTKFTFTTDGKVLIIDEQAVKIDQLPKSYQLPNIKGVSEVEILKKGITETKVRVLDKQRKSILTSKKTQNQDIDQPMKSIFDIIDPAVGVIYQEKQRVRVGKSLEDKNREQNKLTRSEYFNQSHYREFSLDNLNNQNQTVRHSLDTSKLQTIQEQSMEYNNTSHFLHSLHNQLSINDSQTKIYKTINQNEISDLLLINKDDYSLDDPQTQSQFYPKLFSQTLDLTNNGSQTERSAANKSILLPQIPKYQSKQKRTIISALKKSTSLGSIKKAYPFDQSSIFEEIDQNNSKISLKHFKEKVDQLNKNIIQDRNWGYQNQNKQSESLPSIQQSKDSQLQPQPSSKLLPALDLNKIQQKNHQKMNSKPFSPRMHRLLNKSTFIERISKDQAKTSRYDNETKEYDLVKMKQHILKTSGIMLGKHPPSKLSMNSLINETMISKTTE